MSVLRVPAARNPFEIREVIVGLVAILVVYHGRARGTRHKGGGHQNMHRDARALLGALALDTCAKVPVITPTAGANAIGATVFPT